MRHKLLAGIIPFCSGKRKPSTFTSSSLTDCNHITTNNNMLHSKSTYFYRWSSRYISIAPIACALTLLVGISLLLNPTTKAQEVYAAEEEEKCMNGTASSTGQCPMELSIMMSGAEGGTYEEAGATQLEAGKTSYRSYGFKISATDIDKDGYRLYATAVETKSGDTDYTNQLVNADYPDKGKFVPISSASGVAGESMAAGEWGYAIAGGNTGNTLDAANTNPGTLTYKAVPTSQTTPIATGTETTTTDSGIPDNPATVPDEYKLIFGAKAAEDMPSGHYRTQVMLSLVADPKIVAATMQKFAEAGACSELTEPVQLIDDRSKSGITEQKKYWVSKLKDGKCWMTQNLDLPLKQGDILKPDDTNVAADYPVPATGNYQEMGDYVYTQASATLPSSGCSSTPSGCTSYFAKYTGSIDGDVQMHYHVGNLYPWTIAMAGKTTEKSDSICPKGWRLPTNSEYSSFLTAAGIGNNGTGANTARRDPYYFVPSGRYTGSWANVSSNGFYWASTPDSSYAYFFTFSSGGAYMGNNGTRTYGYSVRCVVK